jgi:hypothetical protein
MTTLAQISETQAQKATTANENFDALSYVGIFGRRAAGVTGLTWAYYGGIYYVAGVATAIADGTVALTGSTTNYVEATTAGVVSANAVGFTAGRIPLYTVTTGVSTISSYADKRAPNSVGDLNLIGSLTVNGTLAAGTTTITSTSASALTVGRQGATNPVLQVDASTATVVTGLLIKGAAAAGGVALSAISSGTNENLTLDAKGSGTITLGSVSTGAIVHTRATTLSAALTYGGVTLSNAVTGTGNMVLSAGPTFTGTITAAAANFSGAVNVSGAGLFVSGSIASAAANQIAFDYNSSAVRVIAYGPSASNYIPIKFLTVDSAGSGAEQVRINNTTSATRYITLTGNNGGMPTIGTSAGTLFCSSGLYVAGADSGQVELQLGHSNQTNYWALGRDNNLTGDFIFSNTSTEVARFDSAKNGLRINCVTNLIRNAERLSVKTTGVGNIAAAFTNDDGASSPVASFCNVATSGNNYFLEFLTEALPGTGRGSIDYNRAGSAVRYNTTSDEYLKRDRGIAKEPKYLRDIRIHDFDWIETGHPGRGVFARETFKVFPDAISEGVDELDDNGRPRRPWGADYSKFVPDLIVGWQSHDSELADNRAWRGKVEVALTEHGITIH